MSATSASAVNTAFAIKRIALASNNVPFSAGRTFGCYRLLAQRRDKRAGAASAGESPSDHGQGVRRARKEGVLNCPAHARVILLDLPNGAGRSPDQRVNRRLHVSR